MSCEDCQDKSQCASCSSNPEEVAQDTAIASFLSSVKHKYVVMSGKGGVGKSTVAAHIALLLAQRGYKVGLLDVDLHGPSIAGIFGLVGIPLNAIGDKLLPYDYNENLKIMTVQGLLGDQDAALVWRGPVKIGVIRQFLSDTDWGCLDYLIIDCPPGTGDEPLTVVQTIPDVAAIIVTTPQQLALADVRKSINFCSLARIPLAGIVENMAGFICPNCHSFHAIFAGQGGADLAAELSVPLLGRLPINPEIAQSEDQGEPLNGLSEDALSYLNAMVDNLLAQEE